MYEEENSLTYTYPLVMQKYNAHDGYADAVMNNEIALVRCMLEGIFSNCNRDDIDNYFDFSTSNWYKNILSAYSLGENLESGKVFMLASDYFIDFVRCVDVVFVNEEAMKTFGDDALFDFYELVADGNFTYDQMTARVQSFFVDKGTKAGSMDEQDKLGLVYVGHVGPYSQCSTPAFYSCDLDLIVNNGNGYVYNSNRQGTDKAINKITNLFMSKGALGVYAQEASESSNVLRRLFAKGDSLFCLGMRLYELENSMFSEMKVCPVPYPKVNEADEYTTYCNDKVCAEGIFKTGNFEICSAYIELSTEKSAEPRLNCFENGLGLKYETGTNTKRMLDIIYETVDVNFSAILDAMVGFENTNAKSFVWIVEQSCKNGESVLETSWASYGTMKSKALSEVIGKFEQLH